MSNFLIGKDGTIPSWKQMVIVSASAGAGFALTICIFLVLFRWYQTRPKPWNTRAIRATFLRIGTEGKDRTLVFNYILENTTDDDFQVADKSDIELDGRLEKQKALYGALAEHNPLTIDLPLSIPARQRKWVAIHFGYSPHYTDACIDALSRPVPPSNGESAFSSGSYTVESLASAVRTKFPSCQSVGDSGLVALLLQMYPDYGNRLGPGQHEEILNTMYPDENALVAFVKKEVRNLGGFVLYDKVYHYEIDFPKGW